MLKKLIVFFVFVFIVVIGITFYARQPKDKNLYWGIALKNGSVTTQTIDMATDQTNIPPQLIEFFITWPTPSQIDKASFPEEQLEAIWDKNAVACISWEPLYIENGEEKVILYSDIAAGKYDDYIKMFARKMKHHKRPVIMRLAHNMNLSRYHWGTEKKDFGKDSPEIYQKMVRYIIGIFENLSVTNTLWAFCPYARSLPDTDTAPWNSADYYYPGDRYIDILGMDGYNYGFGKTKQKHGWDSQWESFEIIFKPIYEKLKRIASSKPLIVFETGCIREGGNQLKWFADAVETARKWDLTGIIWFQGKKEMDMTLTLPQNSPVVESFTKTPKSPHEWADKLH